MKTPHTRTLLFAAGAMALVGLLGLYALMLDPAQALEMLITTLAGGTAVGAVTANQLVTRQEGVRASFPVYQSTHIYEGTLVFINSAGYAVGDDNAGANPFAGVAIHESNNSAGADGDLDVEVWTDGVYELPGTGFSQATVGLDIYASDNYTVTTTSSGTSFVGKCVGYLSSTKIQVQIRRYAPTSPLADDASGTTAATFEVDSDVGKPRAALGSQTGGTGNFKAVLRPPSTLTADRVFTLDGDSAATLANLGGAQTFTGLKTFDAGLKSTAQEVTPDDSESALNTILPGVTAVDVQTVTNNADDFIVLPALAGVPIGHTITILCNAGGNFELRTPAGSAEEINSEDCDGTKEYLCTDTQVIKVIKINDTIGWMAHAFSAIGAVVTAVVPD